MHAKAELCSQFAEILCNPQCVNSPGLPDEFYKAERDKMKKVNAVGSDDVVELSGTTVTDFRNKHTDVSM